MFVTFLSVWMKQTFKWMIQRDHEKESKLPFFSRVFNSKRYVFRALAEL